MSSGKPSTSQQSQKRQKDLTLCSKIFFQLLPLLVAAGVAALIIRNNQKQQTFAGWFQQNPSPYCPAEREPFIEEGLICSQALRRFLKASNATELSQAAAALKKQQLTKEDWAATEYIVLERAEMDYLAFSNLLQYPEFIGDEIRFRTIMISLATKKYKHYSLYAVAGLAGKDFDRLFGNQEHRSQVIGQIFQLLVDTSPWTSAFNWTVTQKAWQALLPNLKPSRDMESFFKFIATAVSKHVSKRIYEPGVEWFLKAGSRSDARVALNRMQLEDMPPDVKIEVKRRLQAYIDGGKSIAYPLERNEKIYVPQLCEVLGRFDS